jgi:predicted MFS family arabinose efflux permease
MTRIEDTLRYHVAAQIVLLQGLGVSFILPVYLGALAERHQFTNEQLAAVATADSAGGLVALALLTALIARVNRRSTMLIAAGVLAAANIANAFFTTFESTLALRFVSGAAGLWTFGCAHAYYSNTAQPERWFAMRATIAVIIQSAGFSLAPRFIAEFGVEGVYWLVAALTPITVIAALQLPSRPDPYPRTDKTTMPVAGSRNPYGDSRLLTALILWAAAMGAWSFYYQPLFVFSERIGDRIGLDAQAIGQALAVTTLLGVIGSLAVTAQGDRFGRATPFFLSGLVALGVAITMMTVTEVGTYWFALALFSIVWSYLPCFLMGFVAVADTGGRFVVAIHLVAIAAATMSTALTGALIEKFGLEAPALVSIGGVIACLIFGTAGAAVYARRRKQVHLEAV